MEDDEGEKEHSHKVRSELGGSRGVWLTASFFYALILPESTHLARSLRLLQVPQESVQRDRRPFQEFAESHRSGGHPCITFLRNVFLMLLLLLKGFSHFTPYYVFLGLHGNIHMDIFVMLVILLNLTGLRDSW